MSTADESVFYIKRINQIQRAPPPFSTEFLTY